MRSLIKTAFWITAAASAGAATFSYHVAGEDAGPWPGILSSVGLTAGGYGPTNLFIVRNAAPGSTQQWLSKIDQGAVVVLEGDSEIASALGIHATGKHVVVRSIVDLRAPKLPVVWEKAVELPVFELPKAASIFAVERWTGMPVLAAVRRGAGAALWLAVPPGSKGYDRFPYLLQALADLGIEPPFRSRRLWAFFDAAYRSRVDLEYFAPRWRQAGVGALQVAAWHYFEPNEQSDAYLKQLIAACHRSGILVYAWLELPHVSERFWADHPEWREKTALLQDAQLDWRKLMNLENADAAKEVAAGTRALLQRFDWDGVNLAELYFESLEGSANAARFTPMNDDVRREFQAANGFDPYSLFQTASQDTSRLKTFLDYRAGLARKLQEKWIEEVESIRREKRDLDIVLTHVDDQFDRRMRDLIGADAGKVLPMLDSHDFTFLIEDPATVWNLGPERYPQIAERYRPLTNRFEKLAIDINIVERYQDVYPTKQQTGTELFQLVHLASKAFPRVALYFENSILRPDLPLLSSAAAVVDKVERDGARMTIAASGGVGVPWKGPALVNGRLWPVHDSGTLWLPPGVSVVEAAAADAPLRVIDFNGGLRSARALRDGVDLAYDSSARTIAVLSARPKRMELDGIAVTADVSEARGGFAVLLPRGQHLVTLQL